MTLNSSPIQIPSWFPCTFNCKRSSSNFWLDFACCWDRLIQNVVCFCISSVVRGPTILCLRTVLMLWRNLQIQAPTRNTRHSSYFSSSASKASLFSVFSTARANNSRVCFTSSAFDSWVDVVTRSGGQSCGFANQLGPCHQRAVNLLTSPPRLPTSAGFSSVGTCLQLFVFLGSSSLDFPRTVCVAISTVPVQCYRATQPTINTSYGKTLVLGLQPYVQPLVLSEESWVTERVTGEARPSGS